jgi:glucokinase-like ROK family protein
VASFRLPTPADDATAVLEQVIAETQAMLVRWGGPRDKLIGLGLGITGLVDSEQGVALFSPNLGWENVPVGAMWQRTFDLPVIADNDVRALALGEQWFGLGQQVQSLACLHIGVGIGCGVVVGGKVYRGATGGGGEIGHTVIDRDGPLCRCGNRGCLETLAGGQAVIAKVAQGMLSSVPTQLSAVTRDDPRRLSLPLVFQAARAGDRLAQSAIEQTTTYAGIAVAHVINTFNPEMVVLSGELIDEGADLMLDSIIETARHHAFGVAAKDTPIRVTELGKNASALGTACLVFQQWLGE